MNIRKGVYKSPAPTTPDHKKRQIVIDAENLYELSWELDGLIATEEKYNETSDFTDQRLVEEAEYTLRKYSGNKGWDCEKMLLGERGLEAQKEAQKEVDELKEFIKKYSPKATQKELDELVETSRKKTHKRIQDLKKSKKESLEKFFDRRNSK